MTTAAPCACDNCGAVMGMKAPHVRPGDVLRVGKKGAAIFSEDGRRRRWLMRALSPSEKRVGFIMLNPSKADADDNDPTITRCEGFARREGAGSIEVANLADIIETDSKKLAEIARRGDTTDASSRYYMRHVLGCDLVIGAWGGHPWAVGKLALLMMQEFGAEGAVSALGLKCLGKTKKGAPNHPLYLPALQQLEPWP